MKIYTLHSVADNGLSLSTRNLRRFLRHICKQSKLVDASRLGMQYVKNGTVITFDDCFADNFTNALPVLAEFEVKALFFFTPAFLGKVRWGSPLHGKWSEERSVEYFLPFSYMGGAELRVLHELGHEIGFHSRTHRNLTDCDYEALEDEIVTAKTEWEQRLGLRFRYFAYPRGCYDERMFSLVKKAGYICGLTTVPQCVAPSTFEASPYCVPRLPVRRRGLFGWS